MYINGKFIPPGTLAPGEIEALQEKQKLEDDVRFSREHGIPVGRRAAQLLAAGEGKGEQYFKDLGYSESLLNSLSAMDIRGGGQTFNFLKSFGKVAQSISGRKYEDFNYGLESVLKKHGYFKEVYRPPTKSEAPSIDTTVAEQTKEVDPLKETTSATGGERRRAGRKAPTLISLGDESRPTILGG